MGHIVAHGCFALLEVTGISGNKTARAGGGATAVADGIDLAQTGGGFRAAKAGPTTNEEELIRSGLLARDARLYVRLTPEDRLLLRERAAAGASLRHLRVGPHTCSPKTLAPLPAEELSRSRDLSPSWARSAGTSIRSPGLPTSVTGWLRPDAVTSSIC